MLAGDPHTHFFPIKKVQLREVFEQDALHFGKRRRRQVLAGPQVMVDLAENPRSSLGGEALVWFPLTWFMTVSSSGASTSQSTML